MSSALVRQALGIVDPDLHSISGKKKSNKKGNVFSLIPDNQKLMVKRLERGPKVDKTNLLSSNTKLTITEARKNIKPKEQILQENLKKLELIKQMTLVELDKQIVNNIIERGVTKRPIQAKPAQKKDQKTAFTEEDFKKFEEEYFND